MNKLSLALRPLQKLELLDIRGKCAKSMYFESCIVVKLICIFADNGLPFTLAAKLCDELQKCRIRIVNCNCCATVISHSANMFIALVVVGPGLQEGKKHLHFDEGIASQSTKLDLSG